MTDIGKVVHVNPDDKIITILREGTWETKYTYEVVKRSFEDRLYITKK